MKTETKTTERLKRPFETVQPSEMFTYITPFLYAQSISKSRERVIQMHHESKIDIVSISGVLFVQLPK